MMQYWNWFVQQKKDIKQVDEAKISIVFMFVSLLDYL